MNFGHSISSAAFLKLAPGQWVWGEGPFTAQASPEGLNGAFYVNDFALSDPRPWKVPASLHLLSERDFFQALSEIPSVPDSSAQLIQWSPCNRAPFEASFLALQHEIQQDTLKKGVPISFEEGACSDTLGLKTRLISRLARCTDNLMGYGWIQGSTGFVGATPELLFDVHGQKIQAMALAGSRPVEQAPELLDDPKEQFEHQLVVEDIQSQLLGFGSVSVASTRVEVLPYLAHLRTDLSLRPSQPVSFDALVSALHPTAALGAFPRGAAASRWLAEMNRAWSREFFGAPFGFQLDQTTARAVVSIRHLSFRGKRVRIGAGCGVVRGSRLEREWAELAIKRESVKKLLL